MTELNLTSMSPGTGIGNPGAEFAPGPVAFGDEAPVLPPGLPDVFREVAGPVGPLSRDLLIPDAYLPLLSPDSLTPFGPPITLAEVPTPEFLLPTAVPEPSSLSFLPIALVALVVFNRYRLRGAGH